MNSRFDGALVNRDETVSFEFDGQKYDGHPGDTLASALLANGVKIFGRSFKYHRPRGVLSDGVDEPNALMEIGTGAALSPNIRATEQEIYEGLKARSQNHLGSLEWDALAINDWFSWFLSAGFYYKTFMWPKAFWEKLYEPLIRRAAGLGQLSGEADRAHYDRGYLFCDMLVIGSGLAGLEAARMAGEAGKDVILVEGDYEFGGRLIKDQGEIDGESYRAWRDRKIAALKAMPNLRMMKRSHALGVYDGGMFGVLERVADHVQDHELPRQIFWRIHARQSVLATGATERPIAFANNDRPGVMMAGALRAYLNRYGVMPFANPVIFTNNNSGWDLAEDMQALGLPIAAIIDPRGDQRGLAGVDVYQGVIVDAKGRKGVEAVLVEIDGKRDKIPCDGVALSGGWNPNVHLSCHLGVKPIYDETIAAFLPSENSVPHMAVIGAARGIFTDHDILVDVHRMMTDLGCKASLSELPKKSRAYEIEPLWQVEGKGRAFLDFQNDVSVKDVALSYRENFRAPEHMKRYTTLGMATDQGKTANVTALGVLAELAGQKITDLGTTTYRPPYVPAPIAALGAGAVGKGFAPERFMPSHKFNQSRGAHCVEAGLWYRASYFPHQGESVWRQSCDREVNYVREAVGVCDASSLGKIGLKGKDAKAFLDMVYAGKMSTLKEGRIRYGLMLREDGMVMDDGTCACLGENDYLITTTTAAAGEVMNHFDFVAQCLMPKADVHFISLTDHYAQYAVAGPKSRQILEGIVEGDISDDALPFMGWANVTIGEVQARIYRISFSGELGFEIAVPRRFGEALMRKLAALAEAEGGGVYGLEALNVMRIEKGFITHAEIDGRVSAADLGMGQMVNANKDCIGKTMAARPVLVSDQRRQLVGLKPIGAVQKLLAGSVIVAPNEEAIRENLQGHVSSVCYSPKLGHMIALAFVEGGHARLGDHVRAVDLVRDFDTLCEIVPTDFIGEGLRNG